VGECKKMLGIQSGEILEILPELMDLLEGTVIGRGSLALETSLSEACRIQKSITKDYNL